MTFAATAEVIRYKGGIPVLVDCDPDTLNMDLRDAARKLAATRGWWSARGSAAGLGRGGDDPGARRRHDDEHR